MPTSGAVGVPEAGSTWHPETQCVHVVPGQLGLSAKADLVLACR